MKRKVISGFLFMVIGIVIVHNAIPHHHHEDIPIHHHETANGVKDTHANNDHNPLQCEIRTLAFNVPKAHTLNNLENLLNIQCLYVNSTRAASLIPFESPGTLVGVVQGEPLPGGILTSLSPRAPPI